MWHHIGFGFWAIEEKASGRLIGEGGFHELRRDMEPSLEGTLEMGWCLLPEALRQGLCDRGHRRHAAMGRGQFPGTPITCFIDPQNAASIRVAEGRLRRARISQLWR